MDIAWAATESWFFEHGWKIILILAGSSAIRRINILLLSRVVEKSIEHSERFEDKRDRKLRADTLTSMFDSVLKVLIWTAAVLLVLRELNVLGFFAPILGQAVAVSLIVGFGIQAFVKDFISGLFIVADNQYRVGDVVALTPNVGGTVEGRVIRITLRTTTLRDQDGSIHFIPNGNVTRSANLTLDYAKINVEITLPLSADFAAAEKAINELGLVMHKEDIWHRSLIQAPYYHGVQTFDNDHVTVEVRAKTVPAEQWTVSSELQKRLASLVSKNNFFDNEKKSTNSSKK